MTDQARRIVLSMLRDVEDWLRDSIFWNRRSRSQEKDFSDSLFVVWLGAKPVSEALKRELSGGGA